MLMNFSHIIICDLPPSLLFVSFVSRLTDLHQTTTQKNPHHQQQKPPGIAKRRRRPRKLDLSLAARCPGRAVVSFCFSPVVSFRFVRPCAVCGRLGGHSFAFARLFRCVLFVWGEENAVFLRDWQNCTELVH